MPKSMSRNYSLTYEQVFNKTQTAVEKLGYKIEDKGETYSIKKF